MEFYGFKKTLNFLLDQDMNITKFVSDRHLSIAAFMRDVHPEIKHRFDLWHIAKSKLKVLTVVLSLKLLLIYEYTFSRKHFPNSLGKVHTMLGGPLLQCSSFIFLGVRRWGLGETTPYNV